MVNKYLVKKLIDRFKYFNINNIIMKQIKCLRCGYEWKKRIDIPKQCPRCKRYDWDKINIKQNQSNLK